MSVCREVYLSLAGWSPVDRLLDGRLRVGLLSTLFITGELSFQQLQSEASENNVEAKLLALLAYFNEKDILEQLFAGFSINQKQIPESHVEKLRMQEWKQNIMAEVAHEQWFISMQNAGKGERKGGFSRGSLNV